MFITYWSHPKKSGMKRQSFAKNRIHLCPWPCSLKIIIINVPNSWIKLIHSWHKVELYNLPYQKLTGRSIYVCTPCVCHRPIGEAINKHTRTLSLTMMMMVIGNLRLNSFTHSFEHLPRVWSSKRAFNWSLMVNRTLVHQMIHFISNDATNTYT